MKEINIDGERIFLKKDFLGWRTLNPWKIDGKIVWKNLISGGSWWKLLGIAIFTGILVGAIIEVHDLVVIANNCLNNTIIIT